MKIFFAAPFSNYIKGNTGIVDESHRNLLCDIKDRLTNADNSVFLAHERELWGGAIMPPNECTPLDYKEIISCDVLIALPHESGGVHIELGWASAMLKPIVLLLDQSFKYSPLVLGLGDITHAKYIWLDQCGIQTAIDECLSWIGEIKKLASPS